MLNFMYMGSLFGAALKGHLILGMAITVPYMARVMSLTGKCSNIIRLHSHRQVAFCRLQGTFRVAFILCLPIVNASVRCGIHMQTAAIGHFLLWTAESVARMAF